MQHVALYSDIPIKYTFNAGSWLEISLLSLQYKSFAQYPHKQGFTALACGYMSRIATEVLNILSCFLVMRQ